MLSAAVFFAPGCSRPPTKPDAEVSPDKSDAPFAQTGTVSPGSTFTDVVYYPLPYATPPNLKLKASAKREYVVLQQDELGFTWSANPAMEDFTDDALKTAEQAGYLKGPISGLPRSLCKPGIRYEDFVWEAKGARGDPAKVRPRPFEQKGTFGAPRGETGMQNFPIPYDDPPNVTITDKDVVIIETTTNGFKWKNTGTPGSVSWTARGLCTRQKPK